MSDLKWTKEAPRVAGWYWMRCPDGVCMDKVFDWMPTVLVEVSLHRTGVEFRCAADGEKQWTCDSLLNEWSGPIPEPVEDSDAD